MRQAPTGGPAKNASRKTGQTGRPGRRGGPSTATVRNETRAGLVFVKGGFRFFRPKFVLSPFMSQSVSAAAPHIQPATLKDIPTIMALAEATWEPTYRFIISKEQLEYMYRVIYTPASLRRQMQEQQHTFLVDYVDEKPAG